MPSRPRPRRPLTRYPSAIPTPPLKFRVGYWIAVLLLVLPVLVQGPVPSIAPSPPRALALGTSTIAREGGRALSSPSASPVPATLSESATGFELSPLFWGNTLSADARGFPNEVDALNATPLSVLVWPGAGAGERVDALNNTILESKGSSLIWHPPGTNETQFIAECRALDCTAIMQVPGEIDDPSFAAQVVAYTEHTLGFTPAYWEIGNEPELWKHWGVPWNQWNTPAQTGAARVTPGEYAWEVNNYSVAMRAVDPNVHIIGLPGAGRPQHHLALSDWINATVRINGPNLSAIAFHVYTAGVTGNRTLDQFYAFDRGPFGLQGRIQSARSTISNDLNASCPTCPAIPVLVTEFGSALSHYHFSNLSRGFGGALSETISLVQGMDLNVTNMDGFAVQLGTSNSWFSLTGTARPDYTLYAQVLSHLGSEVYPASLAVPSGPPYQGSNMTLGSNLYAIATRASSAGGRSDLLLLNVNASTNVSVSPFLPGVPADAPTELWEWQGQAHYSSLNSSYWVTPDTPGPVATFFPTGVPSGWVLPAQTVALFEAYPSPASPVEFASSGLPSGARWYVGVGGRVLESSLANLTWYLPQGTESLTGIPLPLPLDRVPTRVRERLAPFPPVSVSVAPPSTTVQVPYEAQWAMQLSTSPTGDGAIVPAYPWANASVATLLSVVPAPGFVLKDWVGSGYGSYSGDHLRAVVRARDPVNETAVFEVGYQVSFVESGLTAGTFWNVTLAGTNASGSSADLTFFRGDGTYEYTVGPVAGYTLQASSAWILVQGASEVVSVLYTPITATYPVIWQETGLATGTAWSLVVAGVLHPASGAWVTLQLANGTYPFYVPPLATGTATPGSGTIVVNGQGAVIPLLFAPPTFAVNVLVSGLAPGAAWEVTFSGTKVEAVAADPQALLPNGTYAWKASTPTGYEARPGGGTVWVNGSAVELRIGFYPSPSAYTLLSEGVIVPLAVLLAFVVGAAVAWMFVSWRVRRRRTRPPKVGPTPPRPRRLPPPGPPRAASPRVPRPRDEVAPDSRAGQRPPVPYPPHR